MQCKVSRLRDADARLSPDIRVARACGLWSFALPDVRVQVRACSGKLRAGGRVGRHGLGRLRDADAIQSHLKSWCMYSVASELARSRGPRNRTAM